MFAVIRIGNEECSTARIHGRDAATTSTGFAEIVSGFPNISLIRSPPAQHLHLVKSEIFDQAAKFLKSSAWFRADQSGKTCHHRLQPFAWLESALPTPSYRCKSRGK